MSEGSFQSSDAAGSSFSVEGISTESQHLTPHNVSMPARRGSDRPEEEEEGQAGEPLVNAQDGQAQSSSSTEEVPMKRVTRRQKRLAEADNCRVPAAVAETDCQE